MRSRSWTMWLLIGVLILAGACTSPPAPVETATSAPTSTPPSAAATEVPPSPTPSPTPTATPTPGGGGGTDPAATPSPCAGLTGEFEAQILVGPAEAVGLEPVAVGSIPFTVTPDEDTYVVSGRNTISYEDVLQREWGTYSVSLEMEMTVDGICVVEEGSPMLDLTVVASGEQMVEVSAGGFQGEYPWSGENTLPLTLPVEEGATAEGEGWSFVLHLD